MILTQHPIQRTGARSTAILAGVKEVADLADEDLDRVSDLLSTDIVRAAIADKENPAYDWWKILFALYPNAKPTHARRTREVTEMRALVDGFFEPDRTQNAVAAPCTFCDEPTDVLWSKNMLPMFDTTKFLNTLPPDSAGWPVCRCCRIAMWAMPYGAALTAGSATVLTCDNDAVEHAFVGRNMARSARLRHLGFTALAADAAPEAVTLWALREHAAGHPAAATLWSFKNDNQEPWLRISETRVAVSTFLQALPADPGANRGWKTLSKVLTRRAKDGTVTLTGRDAIARILFDSTNSRSDRLLVELANRSRDPTKISLRTVRNWRALHALYLKEMYGMDKAFLDPVTILLADWITAEKNPRGRFNEYCRAAGKGFALQRLLMGATARLILNGRRPPDITAVSELLLTSTPQAFLWRGQLFFEVAAELGRRDAKIGTKKVDGSQTDDENNDENSDENDDDPIGLDAHPDDDSDNIDSDNDGEESA